MPHMTQRNRKLIGILLILVLDRRRGSSIFTSVYLAFPPGCRSGC